MTDTLEDAVVASGCDAETVVHIPRLLSDNGASYISGDLAKWLHANHMDQVRSAPNHPQKQGKIERWHQMIENRVMLENCFLRGALEQAISQSIDHYNHHRCRENIGNVAPADAHFGRGTHIMEKRRKTREQALKLATLAQSNVSHKIRNNLVRTLRQNRTSNVPKLSDNGHHHEQETRFSRRGLNSFCSLIVRREHSGDLP